MASALSSSQSAPAASKSSSAQFRPVPAQTNKAPVVTSSDARAPMMRPNSPAMAADISSSAAGNKSVVKAAAAHDVRAIRSRDDDLEEIFLRYYREEGAT